MNTEQIEFKANIRKIYFNILRSIFLLLIFLSLFFVIWKICFPEHKLGIGFIVGGLGVILWNLFFETNIFELIIDRENQKLTVKSKSSFSKLKIQEFDLKTLSVSFEKNNFLMKIFRGDFTLIISNKQQSIANISSCIGGFDGVQINQFNILVRSDD